MAIFKFMFLLLGSAVAQDLFLASKPASMSQDLGLLSDVLGVPSKWQLAYGSCASGPCNYRGESKIDRATRKPRFNFKLDDFDYELRIANVAPTSLPFTTYLDFGWFKEGTTVPAFQAEVTSDNRTSKMVAWWDPTAKVVLAFIDGFPAMMLRETTASAAKRLEASTGLRAAAATASGCKDLYSQQGVTQSWFGPYIVASSMTQPNATVDLASGGGDLLSGSDCKITGDFQVPSGKHHFYDFKRHMIPAATLAAAGALPAAGAESIVAFEAQFSSELGEGNAVGWHFNNSNDELLVHCLYTGGRREVLLALSGN